MCLMTDQHWYVVISYIFAFKSPCFDRRYWTSSCIFRLRVPNEGVKSMDRMEVIYFLLAEVIQENDDLIDLKEDMEDISERAL